MSIDLESVKALVSMAYLPHASEAFGDDGSRGITSLLDAVKLIYQRCPPEALQSTLTVVLGMSATPHSPVIAALGECAVKASIGDVGKAVAGAGSSSAVVEIAKDGTYRVLIVSGPISLGKLAQVALVYHFDDGVERILAKGHDDYLQKLSPILRSNFAVPTLNSLEEALGRYGTDFALESKCRILAPCWEGGVDGPRLVLVNKPEWIMRDSLIQALQLMLRDTTVRPEQNTDESKPVDIRVEWFASGASALVEVKWLGKSTAKPSKPRPVVTYTEYGPPRAQDGANQLADYMDRDVRHSGATVPRGYLVVFDARRKNTKGATDPLSESDAMHFATDKLTFDPDHAKSRSDFAEPVRFFLNPRKSHFMAA